MWLAQQQLDIGVLLTAATATGGGLWWVVRLIWRFQRDVVDRYSVRIGELEGRVKVLEEEREQLRRTLIACATERGALRAMVRQHGIEWNPSDWENGHHD